MSWKDALLPGSFRSVPFVCESADGEIGRRVALHEYPLRDAPYAEDMGRKSRRLSLEVYVLGVDYMSGRDALIKAFEQPGPGLLVHPYLGKMSVTVLEVRGPRESTREGGMARFSLSFVEAGASLFPVSTAQPAHDTRSRADLAAGALQREFARDFDADRPQFVFDHAQTMVARLADKLSVLRQTLPGVPAVVSAYVSDLQSLSASTETLIRAPADLAVAIYERVADLALLPDRPDRALSAYRQLWDLFASDAEIPGSTPSRIAQAGNQAAMTALVQRAAVIEAVRTASDMEFSSTDDAARLRDELAARLDAEAETAGDESYLALTELRVAMLRDITARGADLARVVSYTPPATLPALVLAHRLYTDPDRADRIVARNRIRHPGFIHGGDALEVLTDA